MTIFVTLKTLLLILIILFFGIFGLAQSLQAATINSASCGQNDVQTAVNSASDGDTVMIPAGECSWITPTSQTPSVLVHNKGITIQGAGIGQTVIHDETDLSWNETPFRIDITSGKPFRITGLTIIGQGVSTYDSFAVISLYGSGNHFRVDHIRFDDIAGRSISISGKIYGLIDHCEFIQPNGQGVHISDDRGSPQGSTAWEEPMSYGTADAVFIEDSLFQWGSGADGTTDCGNGGRYVFRHNTVSGIMAGNHGMESKPRSCMQMEIYDNTFLPSSHNVYVAIHSRGGSAVIFNNTITGNYQLDIGITNYRSCCYAGAACTPSPDPPYGTCNGDDPLDGNTPPKSTYKGWPCKDQIGRGTSQASHPLYVWNNTKNGSAADVTVYNNWAGCIDPQPSDHIKENRDYFMTPKPDYTPYTYPHPLTTGICPEDAATIQGEDGYYTSIKKAYDKAENKQAILMQAMTFDESLTLNKAITLRGGYNCDFTSNDSGYSTISGKVTIGGSGGIIIERVIIK
jgi:hypothetical protein